MAESTQPFGILAVLFLAFGIPFSGKIFFFSEPSSSPRHLVMGSGGLRSGGSTVPVSSKTVRRRCGIENEGYGFSFSERYLDRPVFSGDESYPPAKRHEGDDEIPLQASAGASSLQRFLANASASQATAEGENVAQAEVLSLELPATEAPQMFSLQNASESTSVINQTSLVPSVAVPPSVEDDAIIQAELPLSNTENASRVLPSFNEWNGDGKLASEVFARGSTGLSRTTTGSCVYIAPGASEDIQCLATPMNFSQRGFAEAKVLPDDHLFHRSSRLLTRKRRRSSSVPPRLSEESCFLNAF